jgi:signal peptidase I
MAQGVFLVAALVVSAKVTVRTRSVAKGGFCLYGLFVLGGLLFTILLPELLVDVTGDPHIGRAFPDAAGMMGIIFLYWIPAFAFAGLVRLFVDRFSRLPGVVRARDVFSGQEPGEYLVFRVAGLPGERVRIDPPWLVVNDKRVVDPPIFGVIGAQEHGYKGFSRRDNVGGSEDTSPEEILLGNDEYFLLGDDSHNAYDSRYIGPIPRKNIVGRVTRIYWPLHRINALDGRW